MRILVDLDGISADFFGSLLPRYAELTGETLGLHDIRTWNMSNHVRHGKVLNHIFSDGRGFFRDLKPLGNALECMRDLKVLGHDVVVATTPASPHSAEEKYQWLAQHAPWLDKHNIMMSARKELIKADVLIDDSPSTAERYRAAWPDAKVVSIQYPYNRDCQAYHFLGQDYRDPIQAWWQIMRFVLA